MATDGGRHAGVVRDHRNARFNRSRWAAVGAAVAVSLGAGGVGWMASAANSSPSTFVAIAPCRLFDTRPAPDNVGNRNTPLAAGEELTRPVWGTNGNCTIPTNATAIAYNLTVPTSISGFLTIFPADAARPTSSSINPVAGESVKANGGIVGLSATGAIKLYTLTGPTDAILDITGYYTAATGGSSSNVIPSGQTVIGQIIWDSHAGGFLESDSALGTLPGVAPVPLTDSTVNFGATSGAEDADPACTGSGSAPTAPPGKLCIYSSTLGVNNATMTADVGDQPSQFFYITFFPNAGINADEIVYASWAYTAP